MCVKNIRNYFKIQSIPCKTLLLLQKISFGQRKEQVAQQGGAVMRASHWLHYWEYLKTQIDIFLEAKKYLQPAVLIFLSILGLPQGKSSCRTKWQACPRLSFQGGFVPWLTEWQLAMASSEKTGKRQVGCAKKQKIFFPSDWQEKSFTFFVSFFFHSPAKVALSLSSAICLSILQDVLFCGFYLNWFHLSSSCSFCLCDWLKGFRIESRSCDIFRIVLKSHFFSLGSRGGR